MKKFVCFALIIMFILPMYGFQKKELLHLDGINEIYLVENGESGQKYIKKENASLSELQKAEGVILVFDKSVDEVKNELNFKQVKVENVDGIKIIYGYTGLYSSCIHLDGKQVNVQIVQRQNQTIAGFPIILSGF